MGATKSVPVWFNWTEKMLVLSRKKDEKIHIGDNVVITVVEIRGQVVRLGFDAPRDVIIKRGELVEMDAPSPSAATPVPTAVETNPR